MKKINCSILDSKEDFCRLMQEILSPLKDRYSDGCARLDLGVTATNYDRAAIGLEGFSRPLWALVPFWCGGGKDTEFVKIYQNGLINGTDPNHEEYWGGFHPFDQRFVEMAAISYGLILTPEILWDPLDDEQKNNLAKWLYGINEYELPICNWILFAVLVNIALKKRGMKYDAQKLEMYLDGLEKFYLGDGWYCDGDSQQKDYYVSFAIHFYSLFYAMVMGEDDPQRAQLYKDRALEFGRDFAYWFDDEGTALPFGRSLTYRFSQIAFYSICLCADVYPYSVGEIKGMIVRHLQDWMSRPIFDADGVLTIGYGYPNLVMAERYNSCGSPYWSMKTFAMLMLPDDHPFWSAKALEMPKLSKSKALVKADMLIRRHNGHVTAFVPGKYSPFGHGQLPAKYSKFAYDTKFSINVSKSCYELHECAPDSMLAFVINGYTYVRRISESYEVKEDSVISVWSPYEGIKVTTTVTPTEYGHMRHHVIESNRECVAYDCGHAVQIDVEGEELVASENKAYVKNKHLGCEVISEGDVDGIGEVIIADPNTNILYPMTRIPAVKYEIKEGTTILKTKVTAKYDVNGI